MGAPHFTTHLSTSLYVAHPHSVLGYYDQRRILHRIGIAFYQLPHRSNLLGNRHVDETDDAWVRQSTDEHQFAEVLVLSDEDPLLLKRQSQEFFILGAWVPFYGR